MEMLALRPTRIVVDSWRGVSLVTRARSSFLFLVAPLPPVAAHSPARIFGDRLAKSLFTPHS